MIDVDSLEAYDSEKILSYNEAIQKISELKSQGKKVGNCHGGFDLLHPGHVKHFESAKKLCDVLFVTVTADKYIPGRKGDGRPIYPEKLRAYMIASLESVDHVVIIDDPKAITMLKDLKPSYYIKGPDYIDKNTPGINAERDAIKDAGGEMKYTNDPKLGTTEIIDYIKSKIPKKKLLIGIDRDGTIIKNDDWFGRYPNWREEIEYCDSTISLISYLQTKYDTTKIVVSNQQGVARNYFTSETVEAINKFIEAELKSKGIKIDNWQYCPDADASYAELKQSEIQFNPLFVKEVTRRKPNPQMLFDGLKEINAALEDFDKVLILGDREDDRKLAENIKAKFINVKDKEYSELVSEAESLI